MDYFAQQLINGIVLGSIYGLIAIGYTMVYGIVGMINFAHGDIFMIGGFIALISFLILVSIGLTVVPVILLIVLLVSMAITALYGWTVERIAYRPLRHSFRLAPMLSAIGMSFVLSNYSQVAQGARVKPVPPIITGGYTLFERDGFAVRLSNVQIVVVVTTIVLLAIFTWLVARDPARPRHARLRAGSDHGSTARGRCRPHHLHDLRDRRRTRRRRRHECTCCIMAWSISSWALSPASRPSPRPFSAASASLPGAMLGGLAIGLIETLWSAYFSVEYKDVAAFSILIVVLIFLPTGLLGRPEVEKSLTGDGVTTLAPEPTPASRLPGVAFIFKKALISALVALVLFSLMIGIRTEAGPTGQLIYWTRFGDLAAMVAIVFGGSIVVELLRQWWDRLARSGWFRHP